MGYIGLAVLVFAMLTLFLIFAPGFLYTENVPRKTEAVVLFVGPGNEARIDEARHLVKEGYARYLLIPSTGEMFKANPAGGLVRIAVDQPQGNRLLSIRMPATYKKYYENTHIEALEAKRIMDELGLKSAMLVSSGYHMRRIKMIAGRVFGTGKYSLSFNPVRWQQTYTASDWFQSERRRNIISEYVKMLWFQMYSIRPKEY